MECRINVKLNKLSSEVITQMKWMFNKDKYPNNMKKFTIIPKWNMYTIKMNTQNERVIVFMNARILTCLYPNTEYIRQVKYPN